MRRGASWAYANSKVPDQPTNLIRDFGIYTCTCKTMRSTLFRDSVNEGEIPDQTVQLHKLIWAFALFI